MIKKGNLIEEIDFFKVTTYKYDDNKNIVEIREKWKSEEKIKRFNYSYDYKLNWTKKVIFENGQPKKIIEREIAYFSFFN